MNEIDVYGTTQEALVLLAVGAIVGVGVGTFTETHGWPMATTPFVILGACFIVWLGGALLVRAYRALK